MFAGEQLGFIILFKGTFFIKNYLQRTKVQHKNYFNKILGQSKNNIIKLEREKNKRKYKYRNNELFMVRYFILLRKWKDNKKINDGKQIIKLLRSIMEYLF